MVGELRPLPVAAENRHRDGRRRRWNSDLIDAAGWGIELAARRGRDGLNAKEQSDHLRRFLIVQIACDNWRR